MLFSFILLAVALVATSCGTESPFPPPADGSSSYPIADVSSDFQVEEWSSVPVSATSMTFLPDGRALVITKGGWSGPGTGLVKLFDADGTFVWDVGRIPVCTDAERGLLGIALDPDYTSNRFVYLFYTRQMNDCALNKADTAPVWNRISRFVLADSGIDFADETVIVDEMPGHESAHNGGDLEFAPDGMLLASVGEATRSGQHDPSAINGKILRIDTRAVDLTPDDNPFAGQPYPANIVYATGLRNPFRIAVRDDGLIVAADVGADSYEELDVIKPGADYGWPESEGPGVQAGSTEPAAWYRHGDGCESAIIGGDFVGPDLVPRAVGHSVFVYSDMVCQSVIALDMQGETVQRGFRLATIDRQLADLKTGPDGMLYLVPIGPGEFPILRLRTVTG